MGILSSIIIHTLCNVFLSITMNKAILLCLILAFATTTYGDSIDDCWDECDDVWNTCLKECPASQECQDYIEYEEYDPEYTDTHPCGKCGEECLVDGTACMDKCDEMEAE